MSTDAVLRLRLAVLALFFCLNVALTSVAVWNVTLAETAGMSGVQQIDAYIIFIGGCGVTFAFSTFDSVFLSGGVIGLSEWIGRLLAWIAFHPACLQKVWFECAWVGIFCVLEFAAAVVFTVKGTSMCRSSSGIAPVGRGGCPSRHVLLGLLWVIFGILFLYIMTLCGWAIRSYNRGHRGGFWQCAVINYRWHPSSSSTKLTPSPRMSHFRRPDPIVTRESRATPAELFPHRDGLSPAYQIEHYHPPSRSHVNSLRESIASLPAPSKSKKSSFNSSLYSDWIRSSFASQAHRPQQHTAYYYQPNEPPSPPPDQDRPRTPTVSSRPLLPQRRSLRPSVFDTSPSPFNHNGRREVRIQPLPRLTPNR
ncbi:hypothetical protein FISHEDRAFT_71265 [Fistulina hepatica ATCC 64428]|nr:hypothetical protein FISHEDRAFT_71265 [Fistulina hepatica ATCC 64428]